MEDKKMVYRAEFNTSGGIAIAGAKVEKIDEKGRYHVSFDVPDSESVFLYSSVLSPEFAKESVPLALCDLARRCERRADDLEDQSLSMRKRQMRALVRLQSAVEGNAAGIESPSK